MKFLCVCYYDAAKFAEFTPADLKRLGEICASHDEAFKASGKVRFVGSLGMPHEFKTMRAKGGASFEVADGPYVETKEPFGAFFLIDADDIDEAVAVARLHPGTHLGDVMSGGIEIRPVGHFEQL